LERCRIVKMLSKTGLDQGAGMTGCRTIGHDARFPCPESRLGADQRREQCANKGANKGTNSSAPQSSHASIVSSKQRAFVRQICDTKRPISMMLYRPCKRSSVFALYLILGLHLSLSRPDAALVDRGWLCWQPVSSPHLTLTTPCQY
jgi:hypothetical protein